LLQWTRDSETRYGDGVKRVLEGAQVECDKQSEKDAQNWQGRDRPGKAGIYGSG